MSIDIPNFRIPEVPQGEELFRKTVDFARRSLTETYPILNRAPYSALLPTTNTITIIPNRQMQELEKEEAVKNNVLYKNLIAAGLSADHFDQESLLTSKTFIYRDKSSKIFVSNEALIDITSGDDTDRVKTAYFLGLMIIQDYIQNAPIKRSLPTFPWKELVKRELKSEIFDVLRKSAPELQMEKLDVAEKAETILIDTRGQFTAQGCMVTLSFSHLDPEAEEYYMGSNFNMNIALGLSHNPSLKFAKLFNAAFLERFHAILPKKAQGVIASEKICAALGIPPQTKDFPKGQKLPNDLDSHQLIDYYLESLIPLYCIAADAKSGINPWAYPI